VSVDYCNYFEFSATTKTRGLAYKLVKSQTNSGVHGSFLYSVINAWNSLTSDTNFGSLSSFRQALLSTDLSKFMWYSNV